MPDRIIICHVCGTTFVFKEADQRRYAELGFKDPKRCPHCRKQKRKPRRLRAVGTELGNSVKDVSQERSNDNTFR
jgi:hypothetical protein